MQGTAVLALATREVWQCSNKGSGKNEASWTSLGCCLLKMITFIFVFQGLRTKHCHSKRPLGCLLECVSREKLKIVFFPKLIVYHTYIKAQT